ncbi:MAG: helix-turn-helix transcriptional regulator [bacterium]|nr:helix-turn-helix transcriptional regulator [bacterium]
MGHIEIKLEELLKVRGISKNKICKHCDMQRTQLNKYCTNQMERVGLAILARLCEYIDCSVSDILEYKE